MGLGKQMLDAVHKMSAATRVMSATTCNMLNVCQGPKGGMTHAAPPPARGFLFIVQCKSFTLLKYRLNLQELIKRTNPFVIKSCQMHLCIFEDFDN